MGNIIPDPSGVAEGLHYDESAADFGQAAVQAGADAAGSIIRGVKMIFYGAAGIAAFIVLRELARLMPRRRRRVEEE